MRRTILALVLVFGVIAGRSHLDSESEVGAGTTLRLDIPELVAEADLVFEGRVLEARTYLEDSGRIETEYTFLVDRTMWGEDQVERSVVLPGGVLEDGRGLVISGMPSVRAGEDVLVFLSEAGDTGVRMPVGLSQGKFRVETSLQGGRALTRYNGSLSLLDPATGSLHPAGAQERFDYANVIAEIYAAADRRRAEDRR